MIYAVAGKIDIVFALQHIGMEAEYAGGGYALLALGYTIVYALQHGLYFAGKATVLIARKGIHKYDLAPGQLFLYSREIAP